MESRFWIGQICAAKVYEKLGMYSEALVACERALEFSGGNSEALVNRGVCACRWPGLGQSGGVDSAQGGAEKGAERASL